MKLTEQQIADIRRTHALVAPQAGRIKHLFYEDLFARAPRLRALFELGHQGMAFKTALDSVVSRLDQPEDLDRLVGELGAIHAPCHIRPDFDRAMKDSLIDTMTYALGEKLTKPVERAWRSAFGQLGAAMIERGRQHADSQAG